MKTAVNRAAICLIVFMFLFSCLPLCARADPNESRPVRVGWYQSECFQEGDAEGSRKSGYSYQYLQNVSNYTGWEYEYVPGGWSELYDALLSGDIDLLAGLSYTEERSSLMNYPAYEMGVESYYIYKKAGNEEISGIDFSTLNGKRVGVLRNNLMTDYFEAWSEETGVVCEEVMFDDIQARDRAFADGSIDALIAVNNNVASNSGLSPVTMVGESTYYLAVTKERTDLLEQLNKALAALRESNPYYIQSLQLKYFTHTAVNASLSLEESEWVKSRSSIRVGCMADYMPYCDFREDGSPAGVITDIFREWQEQLGLSGQIDVEYKSYPGYSDLIAALWSGEIDAAFPVHDCIWSSEEQSIVQTNELIESSVYLVYKGEYNVKTTTERIAITDRSAFQRNFVSENYPESEYYLADTLEDCLKAVKRGDASCTFLDSGQAELLLAKRNYRTLKRLTLDTSINYCMGVKKGNNVMYSLLSRGISLIDNSSMTNAIYAYIGSNQAYSLSDFLLDHIGLVLFVALIIAALIAAALRSHRKAYRDILTGFKNKRAYQNAVRQMEGKIRAGGARFAVAVFDLNGLKTINDTYGHELGDMALSDMSKLLKKVFGDALLFRFGGDEFLALELNSSLEEMQRRFALLDRELETVNRTQQPYVLPLSFAKGAAVFIPGTDTGYLEVFERADQAMYADKKAYYETHDNRRMTVRT